MERKNSEGRGVLGESAVTEARSVIALAGIDSVWRIGCIGGAVIITSRFKIQCKQTKPILSGRLPALRLWNVNGV